MRAWRNWTAQLNTSQRQCITPNAYCCLEISAHGLVLAVRSCRDRRRPMQFLVKRFGSQDVEDIFRILRSMTSMWHTQTNVSIKELGERLRRVLMMIMVEYRNKDDFRFPNRAGSGLNTKKRPPKLPSDEMIKVAIEGARTSASDVLERLGIPKDMQSFECSVIATGDPKWETLHDDDDDDDDEDDDEDEDEDEDEDPVCRRVFEADDLFINFTGKLRLRDSRSDKHTYLVRYKGRIYRVAKSDVLLHLTEGRYRGTAARVTRYREKPTALAIRRSIISGRLDKPPRRRRNTAAAAPAEVQSFDNVGGSWSDLSS